MLIAGVPMMVRKLVTNVHPTIHISKEIKFVKIEKDERKILKVYKHCNSLGWG